MSPLGVKKFKFGVYSDAKTPRRLTWGWGVIQVDGAGLSSGWGEPCTKCRLRNSTSAILRLESGVPGAPSLRKERSDILISGFCSVAPQTPCSGAQRAAEPRLFGEPTPAVTSHRLARLRWIDVANTGNASLLEPLNYPGFH